MLFIYKRKTKQMQPTYKRRKNIHGKLPLRRSDGERMGYAIDSESLNSLVKQKEKREEGRIINESLYPLMIINRQSKRLNNRSSSWKEN